MDLLSPASFAAGQPHAQYDWLRENAPVRWHEEPDGKGFWAVTRHADVWAVDRDFQTYSSEPTIMISDPLAEAGGFGPYKMMLMMDPPEHTGFRKLIRSEFTEPSARLRGERIQQLAKQIVDAVIEKGACDFVDEVAGEMPSFVIAELMGLPLSDGRELYKLTEIIHTAPEALPPGAGGQAVMKMFEYGSKVIAEKRARPGDDLASKLLACEVDGRKLEDMEFLLFFLLLVDAGGDTTRNLLSGGLVALMENPDQYAWLMADLEGRLPRAREELLRWTSPVIYMRRTAKRDAELGGQQIKAGDKVVMYFGAANRDPAVFDRPGVLDLSRAENPHIAFGTGPHGCLGQHIARIEIDAMLREVLTRMGTFELAAPVEWLASNFISGPKAMPIRFRAT
ncbi:MAG: cytochrome P450 [Alphaproteobacteria bacterium]|nr:cytochrome P450 [Alphaproteobacteria bacterium]MBU1515963.1 cytochrome P450 [Alphaproteobacteria bacterium]MBU2092822.1 cytochrome P450 [Alphaproteobacteria bacterium]MBU2153653.1 cytochrome P450 [Alphaproteobacteria bacterium]MBU2308281.1 cytochrome P450 [Alphaproteobacteria bacterium]